MTDTKLGKEPQTPIMYLREALMLPGETLTTFGKEWRSLSAIDRAELTEAARKDLEKT